MKSESTVRPVPVAYFPGLTRITFAVQEVQREDMDGQTSTYYTFGMIEIRHGKPWIVRLTSNDYPALVAAIVRDRYSQDQVEAIVNNYLADPEGRRQEFDELQAWRAKAKEEAMKVINYKQEENV